MTESKRCTQSSERVASHDIELKVSEPATPLEANPAEPEACAAETPPVPESVDQPKAQTREVESPIPEPQPVEAVKPEVAPEPAPRNLSLHASAIPLSIRPEKSVDWPLSRKRQLFNVFYFGLITLQLLGLANSGIIEGRLLSLCLYFTVGVCGFFSLASLFYLGNHRAHQTSSDEFSPRVRRSLRAIGLLVPAFLMMGFMRYEPQSLDMEPAPQAASAIPLTFDMAAFNAEMAAGKRAFRHHNYGEARTHFESAAVLNPQSDSAFEWQANANDSLHDPTAAITAGLRAIYLNPENENAHVILAHAYNMYGNPTLGLEFAQRAAALDPKDGEAYGYMSTSYNRLGQPEKALLADDLHVKYHAKHAEAFEQRARTLERLGRTSEAKYDRQIADSIRWGRSVPH